MLPLIQTGGGATGTLPSTIAKVASKWLDSYSSVTGLFTQTQPAFSDISGKAGLAQGGTNVDLSASGSATAILAQDGSHVISARALVGADLPNPSASTLGGVQSLAVVASKWINTISTAGVPAATQPAFTDISGTATAAQIPSLDASKITTGVLASARGGPADMTASGSGEFWGHTFYKPANGDLAASGAEGTANTVYLFRMVVPITITIRKLSAKMSVATVGGTWDVGLYDSLGNRLLAVGGITTNTTALQTTTLGTPVTIPPGVYYLAQTSSASAISVFAINNAVSTTFTPALVYFTAANAATAGVLPSTTGALTPVSGNAVYPPCVFFQS